MISKEKIALLAEDFLEERDQFIVKLNIGTDNKISIYIDGDHGVKIDDCVKLSRLIENTFDREEEDYELNVSSAGIDQPFVHLRQYNKNIDRTVEIKLHDGSIRRGILKSTKENSIQLAEEVIKKNRKSKKMIIGDVVDINLSDIAETKVIIIF